MEQFLLAAADFVVFIHLLWIVFLILGAWPGMHWTWVKWAHLTALGFSVLLQVFGWVCPITHLEVWLRRVGGGRAYEGTFVGQYLERIVYMQLPTGFLLTGTAIIIVISLWIYFGRRR